MIRRTAARECARQVLEDIAPDEQHNKLLVGLVATVIQRFVAQDELAQSKEDMSRSREPA